MNLYPYATGNLLNFPQTYFYTTFHGQVFINAWKEDRGRVLKLCGEPHPPPEASNISFMHAPGQKISTALLLEWIFANLDVIWVDRIVKKFEVDKRWYDSYDENFRIIVREEPTTHGDLELYIRAAEIFEAAYARLQKLPYLNVLLKSLDTLCSCVNSLSQFQKARLAWLIGQEKKHILFLSQP